MNELAFYNRWDSYLNQYNLYYRELSVAARKRFCGRLLSVHKNVNVLGREGLKVTDEIRMLVLSYIIQLTFGLKKFWLFGYETIYLYPEAFYSKYADATVKGSTHVVKIISLSWKDFAIDHLQTKDAHNVGFAQFAMALVRTVLNGKTFDLRFGSYLEIWFEIYKQELRQKKATGVLRIDPDEQLDMEEQFAKCTEYFFEDPVAFQKILPETFAHLCVLLNQDSRNVMEDYAFVNQRFATSRLNTPLPDKIVMNFKYSTFHWSYNLPIFGLILTPLFMFYLLKVEVIHLWQVLGAIGISGVVLFFTLGSKFKTQELFKSNILLFLHCLFGSAPLLIVALLCLNLLTPYSDQTESLHETSQIIHCYSRGRNGHSRTLQKIVPVFSDHFLEEYPDARSIDADALPGGFEQKALLGKYIVGTGLLGIPVIEHKEIIIQP